jgi:divalent metal cation (Fe/Co/Zn/Cd) transporter
MSMFLIGLAVVLVLLAGIVLFYITLRKLVNKIKPENRELSAGQVWLNFIPIISMIWQFYMFNYLHNSL